MYLMKKEPTCCTPIIQFSTRIPSRTLGTKLNKCEQSNASSMNEQSKDYLNIVTHTRTMISQ
jgi:hypothetical protein